jgi:hypothetical protein
VGEWLENASAWTAPALLSSFPSMYPARMMPKEAVTLSQIFTRRDHWRDAQMFFKTMVEQAAAASR